MYVSREFNELSLERGFLVNDSPTFSKDTLRLPVGVNVGVFQNFDTYLIKISESDKELERNKTSESFSKFWKNKFLNEIAVRNEPFSQTFIFSDIESALALSLEKLEFRETISKQLQLDNWVSLLSQSAGIVMPPITGFDILKKSKSKLEQFLEDLDKHIEIKNWFDFKNIFSEISKHKVDFPERTQKIVSEINEFLSNKGISAHGIIAGDIDYEDEEIQNIKIVFTIPNLKVSENLELSKEIITYLAGIDEDALDNIKIQFQST